MILRIRPSKVRVVRPASSADVALAHILSMSLVMAGLFSFTVFCWTVGSELGALPPLPPRVEAVVQGLLNRREEWLLIAAIALLFAKLIDVFMANAGCLRNLNTQRPAADELPAEGLSPFVIAPE